MFPSLILYEILPIAPRPFWALSGHRELARALNPIFQGQFALRLIESNSVWQFDGGVPDPDAVNRSFGGQCFCLVVLSSLDCDARATHRPWRKNAFLPTGVNLDVTRHDVPRGSPRLERTGSQLNAVGSARVVPRVEKFLPASFIAMPRWAG